MLIVGVVQSMPMQFTFAVVFVASFLASQYLRAQSIPSAGDSGLGDRLWKKKCGDAYIDQMDGVVDAYCTRGRAWCGGRFGYAQAVIRPCLGTLSSRL